MPEFVACPACGCRVQMAGTLIGTTVRCISCGHRFTATSPAEAETRRVEPLPPLPPPEPVKEGREVRPPPLPAGEPDEDYRPTPGAGRPLCPRCGAPVSWDTARCGRCGEPLDGGPGRPRRLIPPRRDAEPHRGRLLATLGNITLYAGCLAICLVGVPLLVVLPLGVATCVMASRDLRKMRTGEVDPEGRAQTEGALTGAIGGMVLGVLFAAGWAVFALCKWSP